jgi:hypothetical protein
MTIRAQVDPSGTTATVTFVLMASEYDRPVSVVGSFNEWDPHANPFRPADDGTLVTTVTVPTDEDVHFRYLGSEGSWFDDPDADEVTAYGGVLRLRSSDAPATAVAPGAGGAVADADQPMAATGSPKAKKAAAAQKSSPAAKSGSAKASGTRKVKSESDVRPDGNVAGSRDTGGVENPTMPDQGSTTGTTPNEGFVGRIAGGDDVGDIGESGAERRAEADRSA